MRPTVMDENGKIIEEKDEDSPREDHDFSKADAFTDTIARATDQDTLLKLQDDAVIIGKETISAGPTQNQTLLEQLKTSKCSLCKEEKSIQELEFVDE